MLKPPRRGELKAVRDAVAQLEAGARELAFKTLKKLSLGWTGIGPIGVWFFAASLEKNATLPSLNPLFQEHQR